MGGGGVEAEVFTLIELDIISPTPMLARPWRVGTREVYIHLRLCGKNGRDRPSPSGIGTLYLCSRRPNPS